MSEGYFDNHLSLSQWAIRTNISNKEALIREDASKIDRLAFLNRIIGLPIVESISFDYADLINPSSSFLSFIESVGDQPYALRAIPKIDSLPPLRNRQRSVRDLTQWVLSSGIDGPRYSFSFEPHIDPDISSIFLVGAHRVVGEVALGGMMQLTKGPQNGSLPIRFAYDFDKWKLSETSTLINDFLKRVLRSILVTDSNAQSIVIKELNGSFVENYLQGYFEAIGSANRIVFIDYNRVLQNNVEEVDIFDEHPEAIQPILKGLGGCTGIVRGKARVVLEHEVDNTVINDGEILVCPFTSPEYVPLITQAAGIVADVGGILSHAAIVCRELKKPCVIGTKLGTKLIRTGDLIEVNGRNGTVCFFKNATIAA